MIGLYSNIHIVDVRVNNNNNSFYFRSMNKSIICIGYSIVLYYENYICEIKLD